MVWHQAGDKPLPEPMMTICMASLGYRESYSCNKLLRANQLLTHCGLVTPYGNMNVDQHWFR